MKSFALTLTGLILLAFGVWMSLINQGLVGGYGAFIDSELGQGTIQAAGDFPDVLDNDGIQPEIDGHFDNLLFIDQSTIFFQRLYRPAHRRDQLRVHRRPGWFVSHGGGPSQPFRDVDPSLGANGPASVG